MRPSPPRWTFCAALGNPQELVGILTCQLLDPAGERFGPNLTEHQAMALCKALNRALDNGLAAMNLPAAHEEAADEG